MRIIKLIQSLKRVKKNHALKMLYFITGLMKRGNVHVAAAIELEIYGLKYIDKKRTQIRFKLRTKSLTSERHYFECEYDTLEDMFSYKVQTKLKSN